MVQGRPTTHLLSLMQSTSYFNEYLQRNSNENYLRCYCRLMRLYNWQPFSFTNLLVTNLLATHPSATNLLATNLLVNSLSAVTPNTLGFYF